MSDPESTPLAPPIQPGTIAAPARLSNWPSVVGTIAIVLGAGGILLNVWTGLAPLLIRWFQPFMLPGQVQAMNDWLTWTLATTLVAAALAVLLFIGGIRLVRRSQSAPGILRVWAVLRMLGGLFATIVAALAQQAQFQAIQSSSSAVALPMGSSLGHLMLFLGLAFGLAWAWAMPVFVLVWFARGKIKSDVAGWS